VGPTGGLKAVNLTTETDCGRPKASTIREFGFYRRFSVLSCPL